MKNDEKILSLYEKDAHVIVRGKAGADVEFGNGLYLAEQEDGLIADWSFIKGQPKSDSAFVKDSAARLAENYGRPASFTADRDFDSPKARKSIESLKTFKAICHRSVDRGLQQPLAARHPGDPDAQPLEARQDGRREPEEEGGSPGGGLRKTQHLPA